MKEAVPRYQENSRPKLSFSKRWAWLLPYTFVLPTAFFLLAFIAYPILFNLRMSFQDAKIIELVRGTAPFVGFRNYLTIFADPLYQKSLLNTLVFTLGSITFQLLFGLGLALFYTRTFPGSHFMRGLYLVSWTIPILVVGAVFRWLMDGQYGLFNWLLRSLGVIQESVFWLSSPNLAMGAVIFVNVWLGLPFFMALLLASLQGISKEFYEAAEIDGATQAAKFWSITLPLIRPALFSITLLGLIYTIKVFDLIWVMTSGGPLNATDVISTVAFRRVFLQFSFGPGAAILNTLFVILFVISLFYLRSIRSERVTT